MPLDREHMVLYGVYTNMYIYAIYYFNYFVIIIIYTRVCVCVRKICVQPTGILVDLWSINSYFTIAATKIVDMAHTYTHTQLRHGRDTADGCGN